MVGGSGGVGDALGGAGGTDDVLQAVNGAKTRALNMGDEKAENPGHEEQKKRQNNESNKQIRILDVCARWRCCWWKSWLILSVVLILGLWRWLCDFRLHMVRGHAFEFYPC